MKRDFLTCSQCGKRVEVSRVIPIDGRPVCSTCLYGGAAPLKVYPIGVVRTTLREEEKEGLGHTGLQEISCIDLLPTQRRFMYKLEEEEFLTIVYYLHKVASVKSIFRRRLDGKEVGVFASRTPHRPSKIAIQDVRLITIRETTLYVSGLDAIEGSPVLDIKLRLRNP
ncbi:MAG: SAM-dependent methyltransferase [Deltaproteobacteria bacterium]|nr:SAM-dependent methyltransferase [Deltaproteobacteria bacterium]